MPRFREESYQQEAIEEKGLEGGGGWVITLTPPIASLQEATFCPHFASRDRVIVAVLLSATERCLLFFSPGCVM